VRRATAGTRAAQRRDALAQAESLGEREPGRDVPRWRKVQGPQPYGGGIARERHDLEPLPVEAGVDTAAVHGPEQRAGGLVRADEEVLAVVDREPGALDAARATAEHVCRLVQDDGDAAARERPRRRASGPSAADHRDRRSGAAALRLGTRAHGQAARAVRHAIHSLRSGVRAILRSSTW
jgi:hypothetical protein